MDTFRGWVIPEGWPRRPLSKRLRHSALHLRQVGCQFNQRRCRSPRELRIEMTLESRADTLPGDERGRLDEGGADGSVLPRCSECVLSKIPIPRAMRSNICACLRGIAVGRKNWMFYGSDNGGQTAAVLTSLIATCKRLGMDPFAYPPIPWVSRAATGNHRVLAF
jgi:hypothetical protein